MVSLREKTAAEIAAASPRAVPTTEQSRCGAHTPRRTPSGPTRSSPRLRQLGYRGPPSHSHAPHPVPQQSVEHTDVTEKALLFNALLKEETDQVTCMCWSPVGHTAHVPRTSDLGESHELRHRPRVLLCSSSNKWESLHCGRNTIPVRALGSLQAAKKSDHSRQPHREGHTLPHAAQSHWCLAHF